MRTSEGIALIKELAAELELPVSGEGPTWLRLAETIETDDWGNEGPRALQVAFEGWVWSNTEKTFNRVTLTIGRVRLAGQSCFGKTVTRTYPVRNDGTLNRKGLKKALGELHQAMLDDIVDRGKVWKKRQSADAAQQEAYDDLQKALVREAIPFDAWDYGHRLSLAPTAGRVQVRVRPGGRIEIALSQGYEHPESAVALLSRLVGMEPVR